VLVARAGIFTGDSVVSMLGSTLLIGAASLALAAITFTWIERPAMTGRFPRRATSAAPGA
jgi:hypothetical protein